MSQPVFARTAERVARWAADPAVLGVVHVGSKSRGHGDALSDDDLEVLLRDEAFARLAPADCLELLEDDAKQLVYDAQYTSFGSLVRKRESVFDLDHWPYESAPVLFDRDGRVAPAVAAAARMDQDFRRARLRHATIDCAIAAKRAKKTFDRGFEAAGRLLVARGARAMARLAFALEGRWVPLEHWLEREVATLDDASGAAARLLEALRTGRPEPLLDGLAALEDRLADEGVPRPAGRRDLFLELIHESNVAERAIHGLT